MIRLTVRKIQDGADQQTTIDTAFRTLYGPQRDLLAGLMWQTLIEQQTADTR